MPEVFNRASSAFVSGFPLKDCGNDRSKLNLFMQRLDIVTSLAGFKQFIVDLSMLTAHLSWFNKILVKSGPHPGVLAESELKLE